jgi:hypothetical protein
MGPEVQCLCYIVKRYEIGSAVFYIGKSYISPYVVHPGRSNGTLGHADKLDLHLVAGTLLAATRSGSLATVRRGSPGDIPTVREARQRSVASTAAAAPPRRTRVRARAILKYTTILCLESNFSVRISEFLQAVIFLSKFYFRH